MGCSSARGMGGLEQLQLTLESQQRDEDGSENASICLTGTCRVDPLPVCHSRAVSVVSLQSHPDSSYGC